MAGKDGKEVGRPMFTSSWVLGEFRSVMIGKDIKLASVLDGISRSMNKLYIYIHTYIVVEFMLYDMIHINIYIYHIYIRYM